jgi:hypothetical protein
MNSGYPHPLLNETDEISGRKKPVTELRGALPGSFRPRLPTSVRIVTSESHY